MKGPSSSDDEQEPSTRQPRDFAARHHTHASTTPHVYTRLVSCTRRCVGPSRSWPPRPLNGFDWQSERASSTSPADPSSTHSDHDTHTQTRGQRQMRMNALRVEYTRAWCLTRDLHSSLRQISSSSLFSPRTPTRRTPLTHAAPIYAASPSPYPSLPLLHEVPHRPSPAEAVGHDAGGRCWRPNHSRAHRGILLSAENSTDDHDTNEREYALRHSE